MHHVIGSFNGYQVLFRHYKAPLCAPSLDAQRVVDGGNRLVVPAGETGFNQLNEWLPAFFSH